MGFPILVTSAEEAGLTEQEAQGLNGITWSGGVAVWGID